MKRIGIFDVIGPNMIGPSSSHTAGALRIAQMARKIAGFDIVRVEFTLYGSFAATYKGHGTDRALLAGIMGFETRDHRIKDAFVHAEAQGISYTFVEAAEQEAPHPNTVEIWMHGAQGQDTRVTGISIGGGNVEICRINGVELTLSGGYSAILITQKDTKGILAYIAGCLSEANINIAFLKLYREGKGQKAYTVAEADEPIAAEVAQKIQQHPDIYNAVIID